LSCEARTPGYWRSPRNVKAGKEKIKSKRDGWRMKQKKEEQVKYNCRGKKSIRHQSEGKIGNLYQVEKRMPLTLRENEWPNFSGGRQLEGRTQERPTKDKTKSGRRDPRILKKTTGKKR